MAALNEIDVTFDASFAHEHMIRREFDGVEISSLEGDKICLMGRRNELQEGNPKYQPQSGYESSLFCTSLRT
jgi:hypothetical protein